MKSVMIQLIKDEAAAKINDYLVISDLHIGFEEELKGKGYYVPSQTHEMLKKIINLKKRSNKLIILGDVKHEINPYYKKEMTDFLKKLLELFKEIIIIKGNHDGLIEKYCQNIPNIKVLDEFRAKDCLFIHGHKMPSKESMQKAKTLALGHFHANYEFKNYLGRMTKVKTWNFYDFDNNLFFSKKKIKTGVKLVLSFPAFNDFFSGSSEKNGPLKDYMKLKEAITLNHLKLV